ncbi:pyridoxamine 5'-phosphate oxidase family protein [Paenibacillus nasutitermitis]|uniref:Uncharacterized protein n=1 Tax=Paenibacillus nasutitermitis TaxID=1652958 RepID=A0A916YVA7_9BACL|nr:pyridoxamine 5'-phosphate oxidase family protein [Paenibacillus nasutitermitis]GGD61995.1 hypothetical protein GCM10010911_19850 [Paenibacillus nasutitermitis]
MIQVTDQKSLEINALFVPQDPFILNIENNRNAGLIVIDFEQQIRVRINGTAQTGGTDPGTKSMD